VDALTAPTSNNGVTKQYTEGRNDQLIYLTAIKEKASQLEKPKTDQCKDGTKAFEAQLSSIVWWKEQYDAVGPDATPPGDARVINFCQAFFDAADLTTKLQQLKDGANKEEICDLDKIDTTG
jgi:hypothetical protein